MKKKTYVSILILLAPTVIAIVVYLNVARNVPTNSEASGLVSTFAGAGSPGVEDGPAYRPASATRLASPWTSAAM